MNICVNEEWWKSLFNEIYLITDARSVCDEDITRREVDLILDLLKIKTNHRILDLCGGHGRHSFELLSRGFKDCTLLDYSPCLLDHAKKHAAEHNFQIDIVRSDARNTKLPSESFDHIFIMGNSLGYIRSSDADNCILCEANRLLTPHGRLLVDITDGEAVRRNFSPIAWHEIGNDIVVCRNRELLDNAVHARELVLSKKKGLIRDETYAVRLYDHDGLEMLLIEAGFSEIEIHTGFSSHTRQGDYGFMNNRMIATCVKKA